MGYAKKALPPLDREPIVTHSARSSGFFRSSGPMLWGLSARGQVSGWFNGLNEVRTPVWWLVISWWPDDVMKVHH